MNLRNVDRSKSISGNSTLTKRRSKVDSNILYKNVKIDVSNLIISKEEIEFSLGYIDGKIPSHFSKMLNQIISQLPKKCKIKAGYGVFDVEKPSDRGDGLIIGNTFFNVQRIVASQFKKAEKAALFACTIGSVMEKWSKQLLNKGEPVLSYFVDTVASVVVESATNFLHDYIRKEMNKLDLKITNRYSPGYCDWSVSEQHFLFSFLPNNFCGITLNESAMMLPIKSISGIIGIGKNVKYTDYICDKCKRKDCTYRSKRIDRTTHKRRLV